MVKPPRATCLKKGDHLHTQKPSTINFQFKLKTSVLSLPIPFPPWNTGWLSLVQVLFRQPPLLRVLECRVKSWRHCFAPVPPTSGSCSLSAPLIHCSLSLKNRNCKVGMLAIVCTWEFGTGGLWVQDPPWLCSKNVYPKIPNKGKGERLYLEDLWGEILY